ncbi:threonylcarbamoyl-AMP synthase [candidate division LCP-89 bacterium B3_LCP]|uniref:Threonylcarbamoyl-AMP synthase n=1 Tax=candidate division LCP-89 bacterium B3_LCP TaxID=2012998 RepID=A0A532UU19_UNCL8|nr:MAG: threonylcarbamoyl-AMP synthase [candidate division LCP-89 bacterium B3_LCP]
MLFSVNPVNPQIRLIRKAVDILHQGEIIALPTDSVYAFGCRLRDKKAIAKLYQIKRVDKKHPMALLCADLKHIAVYARISNSTYKVLRRHLPGPYTFILQASREVPKLMLTKQKTVGLRVPDNQIVQDLVQELEEPILTTTAEVTDYGLFTEAIDIEEKFGNQLGCVIDGGILPDERSTIVDLSDDFPQVLREGKGKFLE